jgi:hypothetical protein
MGKLLKELLKRLFKSKPKKPPKPPPKKPPKAEKPGCKKNCKHPPKIKKPARRHNPCKTKGNDPTKGENSMIDPDTDISGDLKALESGSFTRKGEDYIVGGRTYGMHPDTGTVYPKSGPGIVKVDRAQHQLLKKLNSGSYDDAMKFAKNMPGLDQKKVDDVLKLWKKCK